MNNINNVDLNLLKSLWALLQERHVGRAALRMHVSQSAMSHTLARLRTTFDDPLFIRTAGGLEPTAHAQALAAPLEAVLHGIGGLLQPARFEPAGIKLRLRVRTHEFVAAAYLAPLLALLRQQAPMLTLDVGPIGPDAYDQLARGEIDLLIGAGLRAPDTLRQLRLTDEPLVCLLDPGHPALADWQPRTLFNYPHVKLGALTEKEDPVSRYAVQQQLPARQIGLYTQTLEFQPALLAGSELIAFVPLSVARQGQAWHGLHYRQCPFELPPLTLRAIWHQRHQQDPRYQWLRQHLADTFQR